MIVMIIIILDKVVRAPSLYSVIVSLELLVYLSASKRQSCYDVNLRNVKDLGFGI